MNMLRDKIKLLLTHAILAIVIVFFASPASVRAQTVQDIAQTILDRIVLPFINLLIVAATLFFMYGVIEYIAKSDSDEGRSTGRQHMIWGIIGLVIMISAASIVLIIQNFWDGI